ncbi:AbrB/MazE/SpoVT family DNA-binding domain-containing protein [Paenibacillus sp. HB172176]|uniref:AbrB/MazE/SpoVT family DNA-binding domain-containing protein n=1 Tax=Paenibacillus sp. HB172176 TaxID=2493690 RepID=UPI00197ED9C2|nr:AbrB/MazE/SpoVT family DNA-binding domain-containing protein [Paenibacillus sp. HB172176]
MSVTTTQKGGRTVKHAFSAKLRDRNQVTLSPQLVEKLQLATGDEIEFTVEDGRLIGTPKMSINKDQEWYYSSQWQAEEAEAEAHLQRLEKTDYKTLKTYSSVEEALTELDK